jgi:transcriptional regulator
VVHISGSSQLIDDDAQLLQLLDTSTARHDVSGKPAPLPPDRRQPLLQAIVSFVIHIDHMAARSKLGQNRPAADQLAMLAGLKAGGGPGQQLAALMRRSARG